jgi:hypothetical protein
LKRGKGPEGKGGLFEFDFPAEEGGDVEVFAFDDGGFAFVEATAGGGFEGEDFLFDFGGGFFGRRGLAGRWRRKLGGGEELRLVLVGEGWGRWRGELFCEVWD